jgi:hypothetical protein
VHGLISAAAGNDWSYGASILTFVFPMILFIGVAAALYVLYTKPHLVPGHRYQMAGRSVSATPAVKVSGQDGDDTGQTGSAGGGQATTASGAEDE